MSAKETLINVIKSEICEESAIVCVEPLEFKELLSLAKKHDIAGMVADALSRSCLLSDDEISKSLKKELMLAVYRREQNNFCLEQISRIFEREKIVHIPLKGSVICKYYPRDFLRSSCDIDILIEKRDVPFAIEVLSAEGYELIKTASGYDISLLSPAGVHVELHFSLCIDVCSEKTNSVLACALSNTVPNGNADFGKLMTNEMFVFYHVAHMAKHFIKGGCGIRPFIDLLIIKQKMKTDQEKLETLLITAGLLDFYRASYGLISVWFEGAPYDNITKNIEDFVFEGGVYGNAHTAALIKAALGEGKTRSFAELMFLPRANLEIIYPKLEKHPHLLPFFQVKRWFRIFDKNKRRKIKYLAHVRNSVSRAQADSTAKLLLSLGLQK